MHTSIHNLTQVTSVCTKQKLGDLDYGQTFRLSGNPTILQKICLHTPNGLLGSAPSWKGMLEDNKLTAYIAVGGGAVYYDADSTMVEVVDKNKVYVGVKE